MVGITLAISPEHKETNMNNQHVKGAWNKAKGQVKEEVGHATGNTRMEGEGIIDQVKGKIGQKLGDAKDALKKGVDTLLEKKKS